MPERKHSESSQPAIGTPAPDFSALTDSESTVQLRNLRGKWVVLYWYPKDDTSG